MDQMPTLHYRRELEGGAEGGTPKTRSTVVWIKLHAGQRGFCDSGLRLRINVLASLTTPGRLYPHPLVAAGDAARATRYELDAAGPNPDLVPLS